MSRRRGLLGDVSWLQLIASVLAAVTAAWIASRLGVAGTLIGAALGSFVVTISSAFYGRTLDHTRTLLIQTESGTVIERQVEEGEVREALDEAADVDSAARGARFVDNKPGLHWKTILVTSVVVLSLAMAAISTYELITGSNARRRPGHDDRRHLRRQPRQAEADAHPVRDRDVDRPDHPDHPDAHANHDRTHTDGEHGHADTHRHRDDGMNCPPPLFQQ